MRRKETPFDPAPPYLVPLTFNWSLASHHRTTGRTCGVDVECDVGLVILQRAGSWGRHGQDHGRHELEHAD